MIKKILVILLILILVVVISIASLIVFVNPNNFRGFISNTIKDKTGYELTIEGDLRWHIWPQVSILTDSVKLSDHGAQKPILTADNMRLDVELMPLFSKKLEIKNVFIKSAMINITDESKGDMAKNREQSTSNNSTDQSSTTNNEKSASNWKFAFNKFEVADSTIALQRNDDLINFRNINLTVEQSNDKNISIDLTGNVDKNQQDLYYSINANVEMSQFPQKATIKLNRFDYTYKGVTSSDQVFKGNLNAVINYQKEPMQLSSQNIAFSVNDNHFAGALIAKLESKPYIDLQLNSNKLDVASFSQQKQKSKDNVAVQQTPPVVSQVTKSSNELDFLNSFNAKAQLNIKQLIADKITLNNLKVDMVNNDGIATIKDIDFDFAKGHVSANGVANGKQKNTLIKLNTKATNIDLNTFFNQIQTAYDLEGSVNANGVLEASTLSSAKLLSSLAGNIDISVNNARLNNLNIQSIIENAAAAYNKDAITPENQKKYTEFHNISTSASISNGNIQLNTVNANSETLDIVNGSGRIGIMAKDLDVNLNIKMLGGWNSKSDTIAKLQKITIPLRIYGQFANLRYQLDIAKVLTEVFSDKLQDRLEKLRNKIENGGSKDKSNTKSKALDILGGLLKK
ncbi:MULTISPECIES: outer membrane assembly protein AsmA [unclassified Gilliamella]|uniref:outer membrane assembly protein AsmA n=1 Tax=unclassified Gilliamella TaxID=2685620 RepID=UPI002269FC7E|nr:MULTISPECIES: outer membrane assembly protein AsmA [unclassified Gilliamella]MCX8600512.1 outer membrane assembly protein AsmA [Gilliamella sp. B3722]MCX8608776.1 outer membrane assembly protein AsmA [Gilliamella sp. B3771]MCX8609728.1 outer membrane assembly protein AsmA [Gilliamella sp. B3891]MCX8612182.1 outer membrane assembly protein AsmA [Gilliamella sp. B3773]MCX8616576.1 outer membrane assembly protein AsmA [Gilliamella sp. B3770]